MPHLTNVFSNLHAYRITLQYMHKMQCEKGHYLVSRHHGHTCNPNTESEYTVWPGWSPCMSSALRQKTNYRIEHDLTQAHRLWKNWTVTSRIPSTIPNLRKQSSTMRNHKEITSQCNGGCFRAWQKLSKDLAPFSKNLKSQDYIHTIQIICRLPKFPQHMSHGLTSSLKPSLTLWGVASLRLKELLLQCKQPSLGTWPDLESSIHPKGLVLAYPWPAQHAVRHLIGQRARKTKRANR